MHLHRTLRRRIEKLERITKVDRRIPVYVDDEKDLATRIDELITAGALAEADRPRCVFWLAFRHYDKWQTADGPSRRLQAQARIWTPCATWLAVPQAHAEATQQSETAAAHAAATGGS